MSGSEDDRGDYGAQADRLMHGKTAHLLAQIANVHVGL